MYEQEYTSYTLEEYWNIAKLDPTHKYEYVDGRIRFMTGGSIAHGEIGANIVSLLYIGLRESECHVYNSDVAVQLAEQRCYYPDASVSCDPYDWTRSKALEAPSVVVEVLSPATERVDRGEKLEAYKRYPTIQEILLVDSRRYYVEHYHRLGVNKWELSTYESWDDVLELSSIEVRLALREIYGKAYLELEEDQPQR
ncbi:Uma2 family endonuclease [Ktedonosporobacter rubrisoli]|uniref:Uma2 family endonuclease n=1 Tax=Ktedonosporobacter rubrisoli TaxID=2509675 RepID=A0A4V0YZQ0_KTERU|nr:Uma2 family endonuclease [Ktedonosporobacter rubrisoli]QBD80491.1 Uma2 family endonuclease [Ktedonosporobacter rubrisoli]